MNELMEAFEIACTKFNGANFRELDEADQVLLTIWGLEGDVNNGGFDQYYFNSSGNQAFFAPYALQKIGASEMAKIVADANNVFGPNGPPQERAVRQIFLRAITKYRAEPWANLDRAFYSYPNDVSSLLVNYLRLNSKHA